MLHIGLGETCRDRPRPFCRSAPGRPPPRRAAPTGLLPRPARSQDAVSLSSSANHLAAPGLLLTSGAALLATALRRLFRRRVSRRTNRSVTNMIDGAVAEFSVATFNLRGVSDRWHERRALLASCLSDIDADVLCFQECMTGEYGQDRALLGPSYHVFPCKAALFNLLSSGQSVLKWYARAVMTALGVGPVLRMMMSLPEPVEALRERFRLQGGFFRTLRDMAIAPFFGNSVACRLVDAHEIGHSTLVLGDWRAAQRIEFELRGEEDGGREGPHSVPPSPPGARAAPPSFKIWVVNTHLDHEHPDNRQRQALEVVEWMEPARRDCAAVVLCGDFNGAPDEPFHEALKCHGYRSGYQLRHGAEPAGTWPTGIEAPCRDEGPFECLDYVYVWARDGYDMQIVEAQVYGDSPDPKDPTLFPSDHAAVKVTLRLEKREQGALSLGEEELYSTKMGALPPELSAELSGSP